MRWQYYKDYINNVEYHYGDKSIVCLNTGEIFLNATYANQKYPSASRQSITACCRGRINSSGFINNEKIIWQYYVDYKSGISRSLNDCRRKIICLNNLKVFDSIIDAANYYNIASTSIVNVCNEKYISTRGFKNERLRWQYLEDYLEGKKLRNSRLY